MTTAIAVPFEPFDVEKLAYIVTQCCQHRAWFSDTDWEQGATHCRTLVIGRLSNIHSRTWEVYRDGAFIGLLHADDIVPKQDCRAHFIFFDRNLHDKRAICLATMDWLYTHFDLHTIRVEIPTYAAKLAGFTRKALGFRFEAEGRAFSWPSSATPLPADVAKLGSRKHHAIRYNGAWHDLLLLSLTVDEFRAMKATQRDKQPQAQSV